MSRRDRTASQQHEVEMSVECPLCRRINAIVWPQDAFPLVVTVENQASKRQRDIENQILNIAKELVAGQVTVIAASRELSRLRHDVEPDVADLLFTFEGIDSETDTLPIGEVRKQWNPEALERKDREIGEAEGFYRDSAVEAAGKLIRLLDAPFSSRLSG